MPLVVGIGLMPASILAVTLGRLVLAEQLGHISRLAVGPSGPVVPGGRSLMLLATPGTLAVALMLVGHSKSVPRAQAPAVAVSLGAGDRACKTLQTS